MFGEEEAARDWIAARRWRSGPHCPKCGSLNVQSGIKHKTMTHRCRDCDGKPMFSIKTGTVMEGSKLSYRVWAVGIYLFTTNIKGVSSMRLHRELGISQKAAWFMLHRLRKAYEAKSGPFTGPVESDETYIGGKRRNMYKSRRKELQGRGSVGKQAVVGVKDRATNAITARHVQYTDSVALSGFVAEHTRFGAKVFTDESKAYLPLGPHFEHEAVNHTVGEYVRGMVHTNGIESFWGMLKRGYKGIYHKMSPKHLQSYVDEFAGRHNVRNEHTIDQMASVVSGMRGKRLKYRELTADNGLESGARG